MGRKQDWCTQDAHGQQKVGCEFFCRNCYREKVQNEVKKEVREGCGGGREKPLPLWDHSWAHSFICPRNSWSSPMGPQPGWPWPPSGQVVRISIPGLHLRDPESAGPGVRPGAWSLTGSWEPHLDFVKGIIPCHCGRCPSLADCYNHIDVNRSRRCL